METNVSPFVDPYGTHPSKQATSRTSNTLSNFQFPAFDLKARSVPLISRIPVVDVLVIYGVVHFSCTGGIVVFYQSVGGHAFHSG